MSTITENYEVLPCGITASGSAQVMLELTQKSLVFEQEKAELSAMVQAQHEQIQTQEAALHGLEEHAEQGDQQVCTAADRHLCNTSGLLYQWQRAHKQTAISASSAGILTTVASLMAA